MTAKVHDNGETRKQRPSKIIPLIQLCPELCHFPSTTTCAGMKGSAFRNEKYQWGFFGLIDHQRLFRTCLKRSWLKHCPDWKHQSPQNSPIPVREILEQLLCHQQNTWDFSFHDFNQTKTQSRSCLMIQRQTETELVHTSYGIIPDSVKLDEEILQVGIS